jgi:hypothetical protein
VILQGLSRPLVELAGYGVELGLAVHREVGAFWELLAQKTIGVFVGAALPGAVGIAEVDIQVHGERQALVIGKFLAPIPCERAS